MQTFRGYHAQRRLNKNAFVSHSVSDLLGEHCETLEKKENNVSWDWEIQSKPAYFFFFNFLKLCVCDRRTWFASWWDSLEACQSSTFKSSFFLIGKNAFVVVTCLVQWSWIRFIKGFYLLSVSWLQMLLEVWHKVFIFMCTLKHPSKSCHFSVMLC